MNFQVAIVEDQPEEARLLEGYLARIGAEGGPAFEPHHFPNGGAFLKGYRPVYDIVLMDIQLGDSSGMDLARYLRRLDPETTLIFVTSLAQYAVTGYEVSALDFIVKPVGYSVFRQKLLRAAAVSGRGRDRELILNVTEGVYKTSVSRIRYVEILGHSIVFHTTEGQLNARGTLKDFEQQLDPGQFVRCNRSCLVNLTFVRGLRGADVLVGDETLALSRYRRNEFIEALNRYIGGRS